MDVHPDIARLGTNRIPGRKKENWDAGHDCPASFISRRKTMRKNLDRFMNKPGTKIIILTLTNQCNLRCTYCYEHNKETRTMELQTALDIIEREMTMDDGSDFVCIYYFGGEPYLEFEKIKAIHNFLGSHKWEKGWHGFTTTNGTMVHGEVQDWLIENFDTMEVYLSLDGTREMHNKNRSNSYDLIDIDFFLKYFPFAKMTVTSETLPNLAEGVIALHEKGFEVSSNLGEGIPWPEECTEILAEQLQTLINYYLEHPELTPSTILRSGIQDLDPGTEHPKRFCGVGPMMRSYDTDGIAYPCHAFAPLCIGKEKAEASKKLDFSCPLCMEEVDEKCRNCPLIGNCPTCYGINYSACGNVYHITDDCCRMMKVQFLANAMFQYQQYRLGRKEFKSEEAELKFLRNVKAVQELKL